MPSFRSKWNPFLLVPTGFIHLHEVHCKIVIFWRINTINFAASELTFTYNIASGGNFPEESFFGWKLEESRWHGGTSFPGTWNLATDSAQIFLQPRWTLRIQVNTQKMKILMKIWQDIIFSSAMAWITYDYRTSLISQVSSVAWASGYTRQNIEQKNAWRSIKNAYFKIITMIKRGLYYKCNI